MTPRHVLAVAFLAATVVRADTMPVTWLPTEIPPDALERIRSADPGLRRGVPDPFDMQMASLLEPRGAAEFRWDYETGRALLVGGLVCTAEGGQNEHGDETAFRRDDLRGAEILDRLRSLVGAETMKAAEARLHGRPHGVICPSSSTASAKLLALFDDLAWDDVTPSRELALQTARRALEALLTDERIDAELTERRRRLLEAARTGGEVLDASIVARSRERPIQLELLDTWKWVVGSPDERHGPPSRRDAARRHREATLRDIVGPVLAGRLDTLRPRLDREEDETRRLRDFDVVGLDDDRLAWKRTGLAESWAGRRAAGPELVFLHLWRSAGGPREVEITRRGDPPERVWSCATDGQYRPFRGHEDAECMLARTWYRGPGRYRLDLGDGNAVDFAVDGTETRLEARLWRKSGALTLARYVPAPTLVIEADPLASGTVKLRNTGPAPLRLLGTTTAPGVAREEWRAHRWAALPGRREDEGTFELAAGAEHEVVLWNGPWRSRGRHRLLVRAASDADPMEGSVTILEAVGTPFEYRADPPPEPPRASRADPNVWTPGVEAGAAMIDVVTADGGVFVARGPEIRRIEGAETRCVHVAKAPLLGFGVSEDGRGLAAVGHGVFVRSKDGGRTFTEMGLPDGRAAYAVAFAADEAVVFAADGSAFRETPDGFMPIAMPVAATWWGAAFRDARTWAVSGARNVVAITHDAGATWKVVPGPGNFDDVAWVGGSLVGSGAGLWRTDDEGGSFQRLLPGDLSCERFAIRGPALLVPCHDRDLPRRLVLLADGRSPVTVETEVPAHLIAAAFGADGRLFAVGSNDLVFAGNAADGLDLVWAGRGGWTYARYFVDPW